MEESQEMAKKFLEAHRARLAPTEDEIRVAVSRVLASFGGGAPQRAITSALNKMGVSGERLMGHLRTRGDLVSVVVKGKGRPATVWMFRDQDPTAVDG